MPTQCHAARRTLGEDDTTDYYDADAMPMRCHAAQRTLGDNNTTDYYDADAMPMPGCHAAWCTLGDDNTTDYYDADAMPTLANYYDTTLNYVRRKDDATVGDDEMLVNYRI